MAKNSFKTKNSINLEPQVRNTAPDLGDMYFDEAKNAFASKADYWSFLEAKQDVPFAVDMTSTQFDSNATECAIIKITGSPSASFNIHGLTRNNNAKVIYLYNDTNQKGLIKNQSLTEPVPTNRISTPTGNDLSLPKKTLTILYYDDTAGSFIASPAGGGSGGTSFDQVQPAHGFTLFTPIYHNGVTWVKAQANASNTLAMYVVTEFSTNAFTATKFGLIEAPAHGLTIGEFYFVSRDTAGAITPTEPIFGYSNPVLYVQDATNVHILVHRPALIGDGTVSDSEIGSVMAFALAAEPTGYLFCDGRAVSRTTYNELFTIIGVTHGSGNGATTFNLPDYRGRFLRGVDGVAGNDPDKASRTSMAAGGNTGNNVGSIQGQATAKNGLALTDPGHNHTQNPHDHNFTMLGTPGAGGETWPYPSSGGLITSTAVTASRTATNNSSTTGITLGAGDSETRPKNAYVNYFIRYAARGAVKGQDVPTGTMLTFAGAAANIPNGYLICDGSSLNRADYPLLFAAIGTAWGTSSGTTFNLPDTRGLFLRGVDGVASRDPDKATRTAIAVGGNTGNNVGSVQGDGFGVHTHAQNAHNHGQDAHNHSQNPHSHETKGLASNIMQGSSYAGEQCVRNASGVYADYGYIGGATATNNAATATNIATTATNQNTGGNETRPKNVYVNHIIRY